MVRRILRWRKPILLHPRPRLQATIRHLHPMREFHRLQELEIREIWLITIHLQGPVSLQVVRPEPRLPVLLDKWPRPLLRQT
jgi:hypothetical protein